MILIRKAGGRELTHEGWLSEPTLPPVNILEDE